MNKPRPKLQDLLEEKGFDPNVGITVKPVEWETMEDKHGKGAWENILFGFEPMK